MPSKKKTTRKSKTKKTVSKKPQVKTTAARPAKPVAEPVAAKRKFGLELWASILAFVILLAFFALSAVVNRNDETSTDQSTTQSSGDSIGTLRVVEGQGSGASSTQASGALQPQSTGLQQAPPTTQSAGGLNLQAQTTPNPATLR